MINKQKVLKENIIDNNITQGTRNIRESEREHSLGMLSHLTLKTGIFSDFRHFLQQSHHRV